VTPILHRSQLASLLGLPAAEEPDAVSTAWDCALILDAWVDGIHDLDLDGLLTPTRSRGRTLRNLTVNVFHPFELVPRALTEAVFPWDPDGDDAREAALASADAIGAYASDIAAAWRAFLVASGDRLEGELPAVDSPRGAIGFCELLAQQRWHAAFHYRQLVAHRAESGRPLARPLAVEGMAGLDLPADVF